MNSTVDKWATPGMLIIVSGLIVQNLIFSCLWSDGIFTLMTSMLTIVKKKKRNFADEKSVNFDIAAI